MNLKEALLFAYGVVFATSTPYLKPKNRFLFPTATSKFDTDKYDSSLTLFLGGSGICAHLRSAADTFLVNANNGAAAEQWRSEMGKVGGFSNATLALSSIGGTFGTCDIVSALKPVQKVYVHAERADGLDSFTSLPLENISRETVLQIGGETVRLIPVDGCATESDLVVLFEKRSVMMFGSLFVNRIHPVLEVGVSSRVSKWIATLEELLVRFSPVVCVPGEGVVGGVQDVQEFIRYLKSLKDPSVEFSFCRKNFDWMEIPRSTSLEENFNTLRLNMKTHTSIG
jgi:hypothetical protein